MRCHEFPSDMSENQVVICCQLHEKGVMHNANYIRVICYIFLIREALSLSRITIIKECVRSRP